MAGCDAQNQSDCPDFELVLQVMFGFRIRMNDLVLSRPKPAFAGSFAALT
jgi:hypothetical protein